MAYPRQRDMAQVFVRWSIDHLNKDGVCSLNTSDTWLNVKLSDGALEVRELLFGKIRELCTSDDVMTYSEGDGGNITTFLICFSNYDDKTYMYNNIKVSYSMDDLLRYKFVEEDLGVPFKFFKLGSRYSVKSINNGKTSSSNSWIRGTFFHDLGGSKWIIIVPRHLGSRTPGAKFKLIKGEVEKINLTGEWRYFLVENEVEARRIAEYLNTDIALGFIKKIMRIVMTDGNRKNDWIMKLDKRKLEEMPIPEIGVTVI
jgi:hypothetical protein